MTRAWAVAVHVFALLFAAAAHAQGVYVVAKHSAPCADPAETFCTDADVQLYRPDSTTPAKSFALWRGRKYVTWTMAVSPDERRVYVLVDLGSSSFAMRIVDTTTAQVSDLESRSCGSGFLLRRDGTRIFCSEGNRVLVLDPTGAQVAAIAVSGAPTAISPDDRLVYISRTGGTDIYDAKTNEFVRSVEGVSVSVVSPDGTKVIGWTGSSYRVLNTTDYSAVGPDIVAKYEPVLGEAPAILRGRIYVPERHDYHYTAGHIVIYDLETVSEVARTPDRSVDEVSKALAATDESCLFVTKQLGGRVVRMDPFTLRISNIMPSDLAIDGIAPAPIDPAAAIALDVPASTAEPFELSGWAVDAYGFAGPGTDAVHVWATPRVGGAPSFVGEATLGIARNEPDARYGALYRAAGFRLSVRGLPAGDYNLTAFARSSRTGAFSIVGQMPVSVSWPAPLMALDAPGHEAVIAPPFDVSGWTLNAAASSGTGVDVVHVWAHPQSGSAPVFLGAVNPDRSRPDVGAAFGAQFAAAGFRLSVPRLAPGPYTIAVYGHDALTGTFAVVRQARVVIRSTTYMAIDSPAAGVVPASFTVNGWAVDVTSAAGAGVDVVHVWAFPVAGGAGHFLGWTNVGQSRPDIAALLGSQFELSGYSVPVSVSSLAGGAYELVVFAHATVSGAFDASLRVPIAVAP